MKALSVLERGLFGPVELARAGALQRLVYALLAFDLWVEMVAHGSRYGAGGLNVAHFAWLDAIQPLPDPALYLGVLFASSVLSLVLALGGPRGYGTTLARWALFGLYTYGWAMSQLDSYQHHLFLSIVLFCLALEDDVPEGRRHGCAWGYQLLMASVAIVYGFTGIAKSSEAWRMGDVLIRINNSGGKLEPFRELALEVGLSEEAFWWIGGHGVLVIQLLIMAAYLAVFFDPSRRWRATRLLDGVGLLAALAFHLGAEYLELRVGWFSFYMIILALIAFGRGASWSLLWRGKERLVSMARARVPSDGGPLAVFAGLAAAVSCVCAHLLVDLPGVLALGVTAGAVFALPWLTDADSVERLAVAVTTLIVVVAATLSLTGGRVHYDFYRFLGGDLGRRGQPAAALEAYGLANTWAPSDEDRRAKAQKMRERLKPRSR